MSNRNDAAKSSELKKKMEAFRNKCREVGLKVTPQRTAVYETLIGTNGHPSAEAVYQRVRKMVPNISLDTVNRTLLTLSEIGVAYIVEGSGDAKRFDGKLEAHQHFRCVKCKRIIDLDYRPSDSIKVSRSVMKKFVVLRKTVHIQGICDLCRKKYR